MVLADFFSFKKILTNKIIALIILFLLCEIAAICFSGEPLKIADSNRADATAFNNGRRMARTSDDRLVVVYQDSVEGQPAVMWLDSQSGRNWSQPQILDYGENPSLTIDDRDRIYAAWVLSDGKGIGLRSLSRQGTEWDAADTSLYIRPENAVSCSYPSIEWQSSKLYMVWQQKSRDLETENIYFQVDDPTLSTAYQSFRISSDSAQSVYPLVTGDLEFYPGLVHILWTEFDGLSSRIMYSNISDGLFPENEAILPSSYSKAYPSISVRNYEVDNGIMESLMTIACSDPIHGALLTHAVRAWDFGISYLDSDSIAASHDVLANADDVIISSCAVVWQSLDDIYYAQNVNGRFVFSPRPLNDMVVIPNRYPSVRYKTFREDSLDVVWTAGSEAPYSIMYRRMAKIYSSQVVERGKSAQPEDFSLMPNYPNPFNATTSIKYQIAKESQVSVKIYDILGRHVRTLLEKNQELGVFTLLWDGRDNRGYALSSGLYLLRLKSDHQEKVIKLVMIR
jgi:hypothetical protein